MQASHINAQQGSLLSILGTTMLFGYGPTQTLCTALAKRVHGAPLVDTSRPLSTLVGSFSPCQHLSTPVDTCRCLWPLADTCGHFVVLVDTY